MKLDAQIKSEEEKMKLDARMDFRDFEIRAWRSAPDQVQVIVHSSPAGDMRQPQASTVNEQEWKRLTEPNLTTGNITDAARLGTRLTEILLPPKVADLLNRNLDRLQVTEGLRLRLCLDPALAYIPWEFLRKPGSEDRNELRSFLVLDPQISIVREAPRAVCPASSQADKYRLVFCAMADASPDLKLEEEYQGLIAALTPASAYWEVGRVPPGSTDPKADLKAALSQHTEIFHYTGWSVSRDGHGYLPSRAGAQRSNAARGDDPVFQDGLISCEEMGQLLQSAGTRLAILSACYSARWALMEPLIRHGLPAAIGITGGILGEECVAFFAELYKTLAVGLSLDEAVTAARLHLLKPGVVQNPNSDTWGQFVVYMPTHDPVLLPQPASQENLALQETVLQGNQDTTDAAEYEKLKLPIPDLKSVDLKVTVSKGNNVFVGADEVGDLTIPPDLNNELSIIRDHDVLPDAEFPKRVGAELFKALFIGKLAERYSACREDVEHTDQILRISLTCNSLTSSQVPWEYLYDDRPGQGLFLASSRKMALSRCESAEPPKPLLLKEPLRVLAVISNPADLNIVIPSLQSLDVEAEKANLKAALNTPGVPLGKQPIVLEFLKEAPSNANLMKKLDKFKPHILHIVGHGKRENEKFQLVMATDENKVRFWNADALFDVIGQRKELRAVVLVACQSGAPETGQVMTGVAPTLLRKGIPAVLVMQHSIDMQTAQRFTLRFYHALREGKPIDFAVNLARLDLLGEHDDWRAFGTPVLYTMIPNLFKAPKPQPGPQNNPKALLLT